MPPNRVKVISVLFLLYGIFVPIGTGSQLLQQPQHDVTVVNIAVPVRVFDGDRFVDNLTMADFEVFENGVPQKIEAAYLIRKTTVLRNATIEYGPPTFVPTVQPDEKIKNRHFLLIFEMDEYLPQLGTAIDLFFSDVLAPNDTVRIFTPEKMWVLKKGTRDKTTRAKLAEDIKAKIRNSLIVSGSQLRQLMVNLRMASRSVSEGEEPDVAIYNARTLIQQVVSMKTMNISQYERFAKSIKPLDGQKYTFIFYQKESYVIPDLFKAAFQEEAENRRDFIDKKEIQKLFADADTTANFIFLTKTKAAANDVEWKNDKEKPVTVESGGDFFQAFRTLADVTGGISESTANPIYGFKKALDATENFYLVYYKPSDYKTDGKYKEIEVKVKGGRYQVSHRAGYIDR